MKWETEAGRPTRGILYMQMMEKLRELQELTSMMSHLHQTEDNDADKLLAKGWLGMAEMFRLVQHKVTLLAQNKMQ